MKTKVSRGLTSVARAEWERKIDLMFNMRVSVFKSWQIFNGRANGVAIEKLQQIAKVRGVKCNVAKSLFCLAR